MENTRSQIFTNITKTLVYLILSTLLTWWFIKAATFYISDTQMMLSCAVAGGKWGIQLVAGYFLLRDRKWQFLKEASFICFIGSLILMPYIFWPGIDNVSDEHVFIGYLIVSVLTMFVLYWRMVVKNGFGLRWLALWLILLAIAVTIQLTVVF